MPYNISKFKASLATAESSGGVTGSVRVKPDGPKGPAYQFKYSIKNLMPGISARRNKTQGTDRENLGEVWLAKVLKPSLGPLSPEVSSVYDAQSKRIHIASKYLDNVHEGTLDHYYATLNAEFKEELDELNDTNHLRKKLSNGTKHAQIVLGEGEPKSGEFKLYLEENSTLARSMADALAVSAIGGDHDVNPGNMIVTKDPISGDLNVGRIDFGHACNDLLNAPVMLGGRVRDAANPIFDFFNRTTVAGARSGGDESKFWRDYEGFVPSKVLGAALIRQGGRSVELKQGLQEARNEFVALHDLIAHNPNDKKSEKHLLKSLNAIHMAITGRKLDIQVGLEHNSLIAILDGLDNFILNNAQNSIKAGKMMKLQAEYHEAIKNCDGKNFNAFNTEWIAKFHATGLADAKGNLTCPWFKTSKEEAPFHGTVTEYLIHEKIKTIHRNLDAEPSLSVFASIQQAIVDLYLFVTQFFKNNPSDHASEYLGVIDAVHKEVYNKQLALAHTSEEALTDTDELSLGSASHKGSDQQRFHGYKQRFHEVLSGSGDSKASEVGDESESRPKPF